eukprot:219686-Rhodomonas_salina.2
MSRSVVNCEIKYKKPQSQYNLYHWQECLFLFLTSGCRGKPVFRPDSVQLELRSLTLSASLRTKSQTGPSRGMWCAAESNRRQGKLEIVCARSACSCFRSSLQGRSVTAWPAAQRRIR